MENAKKNWCITINNWTEEDFESFKNFEINYILIGFECGESGTEHLQIFMQLKNKKEFTYIKKRLPTAHIEAMKGTAEDNIIYCSKDKDFIELGKITIKGQRNDIKNTYTYIKSNGSMKNFINEIEPNFQNIRIAEKYLYYCEKKRDWPVSVIWIYGESGCGKSFYAKKEAKKLYGDNVYTKSDSSKWFDGYDGEKCLILDDFRDSWMTITDFLSLIYRDSKRVEVKGGSRQMQAEKIYITTIHHPNTHYANARGEPKEQLMRRIELIINKKAAKVGGNTYTPPEICIE